jgi:DNA (cytosine-5)-methyltransferase 1
VIRFPKALDRTFAEFFAGIGLMRIGLERGGWRIAYANDICPEKFDMYRANFEDAEDHFVVEDIHQIKASDIPTVLLATASFPCNDLSLAGGRAGLVGKQSSAFYGFVRILRETRSRS